MQHVVSFSGGVTSWAAARLVRDRIMRPCDQLVLLFADTRMEAPDVYRFLEAAAANIATPITRLCDGRTPWEVFEDERFLGNSQFDPCSKMLKRKIIDRWRKENCDPAASRHHVGLDFTEIDRFERHQQALAARGWAAQAPLIDFRVAKPTAIEWARREGLEVPEAYGEGFSHANCAGMCVKAGMHHWARLYRAHPDRYRRAEREEGRLRDMLGNVSILTDRAGGKKRPLPLSEFRQRLEDRCSLPFEDDGGGCGCALETENTATTPVADTKRPGPGPRPYPAPERAA